ncbi:TRAP-type C4-dicarboxylate transport system substrate-binding protein [Mesorhizobium sp. J18]|uniref:C4-dicarboxylate TRAP transporter substrate-binding protein n=1 Tax=Mesorhizobium sp. J18 TaxID=935263 RepID=UPI001198F43F|nr:C4-dicarboxylate TRAP transporter substrate-binding protein [Mesorhizobium sp. J18]TWG93499.1 TRAP-type C4-dicarboxylate transport system substrate-binding protein [Mesorhizobium sp. J18]
MKKLIAMLLASAVAFPGVVLAQETISLTVASSHPLVIPWVGMIKTHFMAETDRLLAEKGNYKIEWNEAFGGSLYKANATLTSVQEGITDIGWVFSFLEGAKLPLSQASTYAPFATANPPAQLQVTWDLLENNEAFKNEWEQYNIKVLGLTGTDDYDIYTKKPIKSVADLNGMKLSAPGVLGQWLRGTGANPVDGSLTTFYTDIQTGVSDGVLSLALGVLPAKLYEVAPYITRVRIGTAFSGAIAINKDSWDGLPEEVQQAMIAAGKLYTEAHGKEMVDLHEAAFAKMVELGKDQDPPVTISELPDGDRQKWVDGLPDIAGEWAADVESRGLPGKAFMKAYMEGLRAAGEKPARDWDKDL